jgi:hypothetical protein
MWPMHDMAKPGRKNSFGSICAVNVSTPFLAAGPDGPFRASIIAVQRSPFYRRASRQVHRDEDGVRARPLNGGRQAKGEASRRRGRPWNVFKRRISREPKTPTRPGQSMVKGNRLILLAD